MSGTIPQASFLIQDALCVSKAEPWGLTLLLLHNWFIHQLRVFLLLLMSLICVYPSENAQLKALRLDIAKARAGAVQVAATPDSKGGKPGKQMLRWAVRPQSVFFQAGPFLRSSWQAAYLNHLGAHARILLHPCGA